VHDKAMPTLPAPETKASMNAMPLAFTALLAVGDSTKARPDTEWVPNNACNTAHHPWTYVPGGYQNIFARNVKKY